MYQFGHLITRTEQEQSNSLTICQKKLCDIIKYQHKLLSKFYALLDCDDSRSLDTQEVEHFAMP